MSVVWRAYDEVLGRQVAVKVLAGEFATDPGFRDRIRREAQAAARLSHPAITQIFDYGEAVGADGATLPFVVMELVDGVSAAQRLAGGPLPWRVAVDIAAQVADALATAHARGLVHRDVTPGNVMLTDGGVKVVDFGISAIEGEAEGTQLIGTPAYLSPERLAGAPAQPATDIYCLGVLLCQLLTGLPPIDGELAAGVSGLPPALPPLIRRCLVADPRGRPTARELAERLRSAGGAGSRLAPPRPPDLTRPVHAPGPAVRAKPSPHPRPAPAVRPNAGPRPVPARPGPPVGPQGTRVLPPPPPPVLVAVGPPRIVPPPPTRPRRRTWLVALLAFLAIVVLGCGALLANQDKKTGKPDAAQAAVSKSPPAPPSPKVRCAAQYKVTSDWKIGFLATVTVDIQGTDDVTGWRVEFDFPGNQSIDSGWPGKYTQDGQHVTIRNDNWNAVLVAGKSYSSGLLAHYTGSNVKPTKITLNGVTCADKGGD